jgi:hypothetical protein
MNSILSKQNDPNNRRLLKASITAYKKAKFWETLVTYILTILAIAYPIYYIHSTDPQIKLLLFECSFFLAILVQLFNNSLKGTTSKGALFKEEFDTAIFGMSWKSTLTRPDQTEISKLALSYKGKEIEDWYSPNLSGKIPHNIAIAVCQRINTGWDIALRKAYSKWLIRLLLFYSILLFCYFILLKIDAYTIFLIYFATLAFYTHIFSLMNGHKIVIDKRGHIARILDDYIESKKYININELRDIQDEIYSTRQESAKVPDFFFNMYKEKMNLEYEDYISKINRDYE